MEKNLIRGIAVLAGMLFAGSAPQLAASATVGDQKAAELRAAAERGDPKAQEEYGDALKHGSYGLTKNVAAAVDWYSKSAAQNNPDGIYALAGLTLLGESVPKDVNKAMNLYKQCSSMGMVRCTQSLAIHNAQGRVIAQDLREAERLMELAWKQAGNAFIAYEFALLYLDDSQVPKSLTKSDKWLSRCSSELIICRIKGAEVRQQFQAEQSSSRFPPRPQGRAGVTTCNTQCTNSDCYRTYDDGRQVRFQARQRWNAMSNQFDWDAGSC